MKAYLSLLLLTLLGIGALHAQRKDNTTALKRQLEVAIERWDRIKVDELSSTLRSIAKKESNFDLYYWTLLKQRERRDVSYQDVHNISQESWLREEDKLLLNILQLEILLDGDPHMGDEGFQRDYLQRELSTWSLQTVDSVYNDLLTRIWQSPILHSSTKPYSTHSIVGKQKTLAEYALYKLINQEYLEMRSTYSRWSEWRVKPLINALQQYEQGNPPSSIAMPLAWAINHITPQKISERLSKYLAIERKYHLQPTMAEYLPLLTDKLHQYNKTKDAYMLMQTYLDAKIGDAALYKSKINDYRRCHIDSYLEHDDIIGEQRQKLYLKAKHIKNISVELFLYPSIVKRGIDTAVFKSIKPIYTKSIDIAQHKGWSEEEQTIELPKTKPGVYFVRIVGTPQDYSTNQDKIIKDGSYQVSNLYAMGELSSDSKYNKALRYLDAETGKPVSSLPIQFTYRVDENTKNKAKSPLVVKTDSEGIVGVPAQDTFHNSVAVLDKNNPLIIDLNRFSPWLRQTNSNKEIRIKIYSDRAIYRPGQTIKVHGFCYEIGLHAEQAKVLEDHDIEIKLRAPNWAELRSINLKTDSYGRFSFEHTLEPNSPLGEYHIKVEGIGSRWDHQHTIAVSNYKRPSFELKSSKPTDRIPVGDTVRIPIETKSYSGVALADIKVEAKIEGERYSFNSDGERDVASRGMSINIKTDSEGKATFILPTASFFHAPDSNYVYLYEGYDIELIATSSTGEVVTEFFRLYMDGGKNLITANLPSLIELSQEKAELSFDNAHYINYYQRDKEKHNKNIKIDYSLSPKGKAKEVLLQGSITLGESVDLIPHIKSLKSGLYELHYSYQSGKERKQEVKTLSLYRLSEGSIMLDEKDLHILSPDPSYLAYEAPSIRIATNLNDAHVFYAVQADGKLISKGTLRPKSGAIETLTLDKPQTLVEEYMVSVYTIQGSKLYYKTQEYKRRQPDKSLSLRWSSWRDRVRSGSSEQWTVQVLHNGNPIKASLSTWMYDASLDAVYSSSMPYVEKRIDGYYNKKLQGSMMSTGKIELRGNTHLEETVYEIFDMSRTSKHQDRHLYASPRAAKLGESKAKGEEAVELRKDFRELAYYYPLLESNDQGEVSWAATFPESLTRWAMRIQAHTPDLNTLQETRTIEAYKEVQVEPYMPRFIRLDDKQTIMTAVHNLTDRAIEASFRVEEFDPKQAGTPLLSRVEKVRLQAGERKLLRHQTQLDSKTSKLDSIGYRISLMSDIHSDGEEHILPVLKTSREVVRAKSITVKDGTATEVDLSTLYPEGYRPKSGKVELRVESNPLYLSVLSLPALSNYQSENALSLSAALYSSAVARSIGAMPQFKEWLKARSEAIGLGLQGDRKAILDDRFAGSPWADELARNNDIKQFGDLQSLLRTSESRLREGEWLDKLAELQTSSGLFAWYKGMEGNLYMTAEVLYWLLRAEKTSAVEDQGKREMITTAAWEALHKALTKEIEGVKAWEKKHKKRQELLHHLTLRYLYMMRLDSKQAKEGKANRDFLLARLSQEAFGLNPGDKAVAALVLSHSNRELSKRLLSSLRRELMPSKDGGVFFPNTKRSYWWYDRRYSDLAWAIEAMTTLSPLEDKSRIAGMQEWMLNKKRGAKWDSDLSTLFALEALIKGHKSTFSREAQTTKLSVELVDGSSLKQSEGERQGMSLHFNEEARRPKTLHIQPKTKDVVWASASARYELPDDKDVAMGKDLKALRRYYVERIIEGRTELVPLQQNTELALGDIIVTEIRLELSREIDFLAIADPRLGFAEPIDQVAGYAWGAGTAYYYEPWDTETKFYIDYLHEGTYTLKYRQKVVRSGSFQAVGASLQSVYAPEFTASTGYGGTIAVEQQD